MATAAHIDELFIVEHRRSTGERLLEILGTVCHPYTQRGAVVAAFNLIGEG